MLKIRPLFNSYHSQNRTLSTLANYQTHQNFKPTSSFNSQILVTNHNRYYDTLLTDCIKRKGYREGTMIHAQLLKTHYVGHLYFGTRTVILYVKCGALDSARKMLDEMLEKNVVSWTAMIAGYSQKGFHQKALKLFHQMMGTGLLPNEYTLASILTSCTGAHGLMNGMQYHSITIKINFDSHIFVGSSLLDMYAKANEIHEARKVFDKLTDRDVVSCTAIISGYAQLGLDNEALEIFQNLYKEGMKCNYVTYASLLTALSGLAIIDYGKQVHCITIRSELPFFVVLQNSIIDMYSKCGNLVYARRVFDCMHERSIISWNAMLSGYAKHGQGKEVVKLFNSLKNEAKPDSVTYLALLSGCSHGGLVDEGLKFFDSITKDEDIKPEISHYGCVVDLLGRAGRVEKAFNLIKGMPFDPTAAIWGSLLGACRAHLNVSIGEVVAEKLLHLEPKNAGNYVILSNIYAAAGKWKDVMRVRELMKENTVSKEPGKSWIKLGRVLHTFYTNDRMHPQRHEIEAKVMEIFEKIREAGFVPDLGCVLYDVDDEQKERMILGHSEKLAIAFGLMGKSSNETIQVIKNLRVCVDCHNFAKFVSLIYGREILLRDRSRFHLIVGGSCSCGDYW